MNFSSLAELKMFLRKEVEKEMAEENFSPALVNHHTERDDR